MGSWKTAGELGSGSYHVIRHGNSCGVERVWYLADSPNNRVCLRALLDSTQEYPSSSNEWEWDILTRIDRPIPSAKVEAFAQVLCAAETARWLVDSEGNDYPHEQVEDPAAMRAWMQLLHQADKLEPVLASEVLATVCNGEMQRETIPAGPESGDDGDDDRDWNESRWAEWPALMAEFHKEFFHTLEKGQADGDGEEKDNRSAS